MITFGDKTEFKFKNNEAFVYKTSDKTQLGKSINEAFIYTPVTLSSGVVCGFDRYDLFKEVGCVN